MIGPFLQKAIVSFAILVSFSTQGLMASACDHSFKKLETTGGCHETSTTPTKREPSAGWSEQESSDCPMCQVGQCLVDGDLFPLVSVDLAREAATKTFFSIVNPRVVLDLSSKASRLRTRPPPVDFFLPKIDNWQAFFSIFRN